MKFRVKIMACMLCLMSVLFGAGGSALILISFQNSNLLFLVAIP